jgi:FG-GAP-like repeat
MTTIGASATKLANLTIPPGAPTVTAGTVSDSVDFHVFGPHSWARVLDVGVTLPDLTHTFPADLDFLLLGPDGHNLEFWSDAGAGVDMSGRHVEISDSGDQVLPDHTGIFSGYYRPADYGTAENSSNWGLAPSLTINHPGPNGTATFESAFGGLFLSGSSTWSLYITDDSIGDVGSLEEYWQLDINTQLIVKPDEFNADDVSDILWQRSDGTPGMWLMDGSNALSIGAIGPFNPGPTWQIKDGGDFNGNGFTDILWQNNDGTPAIWLMDGRNVLSLGAVGAFNPGPSWQIKATGDFNFDSKADILWQSDDGTPAIWLMDGMNAVSLGAVGPFNPGPDWHIKATGDFNGDGNSDILWQNVTTARRRSG